MGEGSFVRPRRVTAEMSVQNGQGERDYAGEHSSLCDWRGLEVGRLIILRGMTDGKQHQAQLVEQQRALAVLREREHLSRELHGSLGLVFAFVSVQAQTIRRLLSRGEMSMADVYLERLVDVAREADVDIRESILGLRVTLSERGLFETLGSHLSHFERSCGIHPEVERPEALQDEAFNPLVQVELLRILQEALTNVRKNAGASSVRITFAVEDGHGRVSVRDDGSGFDPRAEADGT